MLAFSRLMGSILGSDDKCGSDLAGAGLPRLGVGGVIALMRLAPR